MHLSNEVTIYRNQMFQNNDIAVEILNKKEQGTHARVGANLEQRRRSRWENHSIKRFNEVDLSILSLLPVESILLQTFYR